MCNGFLQHEEYLQRVQNYFMRFQSEVFHYRDSGTCLFARKFCDSIQWNVAVGANKLITGIVQLFYSHVNIESRKKSCSVLRVL